ncbi:5-methyltetrahydropteroyltriglutamate--homocysteine S-methyltransferase [Halobacillus shinanisalinarum]|uniref:5-methyltetrahydropteroyltriglutamate--homocysteine S-methyltransferase n=1 Tax=Halobacillus shinanisalinarum TaxID=2932258 RepID=A0ABY4H0U3_9BACI|nr:5-methyltetrahydropteroyltriglutamate--homocysteine S-methyltransferase [Halobacillus shinanisalinarum]UOQ93916.1 5-methyltetrahydropteroyltriglutamate--homocysteine S-methyltransferase [Halobacillus shinanisalinarum]
MSKSVTSGLKNKGGTVPPFRADHVGSLLRSARIEKARLQKAAGDINSAELRAIEDTEIIRIVEKQKEIGLEAITDGDFRRAWWHFDFLEGLDGVEGFVPEKGLEFHNTVTKAYGVKVTGKIDFTDHPMLEDYKFLHSIAESHTAKFTIPSPNMLFVRGKNIKEIYDTTEGFVHDLTIAYKKAIRAFYDAGCRYLQLDDTAWSQLFSEEGNSLIRRSGFAPVELSTIFANTINEAIADRPDDLKVTLHICRGNFQSSYSGTGGYETVSETIFNGLDVDGLFLEFDDERSGSFEPLRHVKRSNLQIVLGVITSKFGELEDADAIKKRINEASEYVDLNQLCLSPQCGFASTEEGNLITEEEQWEKLKHVITISKDVWK